MQTEVQILSENRIKLYTRYKSPMWIHLYVLQKTLLKAEPRLWET